MTDRAAVPSTDDPSVRLEKRKQHLFIILAGVFLTNALIAEFVGGKLFQVPVPLSNDDGDPIYTFVLSCGVIIWPVVFITTDIINEYFGRDGVRRLSILGAVLIAYAFFAVWLCQFPKAPDFSPIDDDSFKTVFIQSQWIIVGSIIAFLLAQLIDVWVFWLVRRRTGHRLLWVRATGSTLVSQLIDTVVVAFIGLYLPSLLGLERSDEPFTFGMFVNTASSGYAFKFVVALAVTPLLYLAHAIIDRYLGVSAARTIVESVAHQEDAADRDISHTRF